MQVYRGPHKRDGASCESVYTIIPLAPSSVYLLLTLFLPPLLAQVFCSIQEQRPTKVLYPEAPKGGAS